MSPEQIRGERAGLPADLYSLGVTMFHLLTGAAPFVGASEFEVSNRHLRSAPPDPRSLRPECPRWLGRFVLRLLEKSSGDRFRDGAAALVALRRRRTVASPSFWRRRALAAVAIVIVVGVGWGLARVWRGSPARATVVGDEIVASNARGRELWRRRFDRPPVSVVVADLMAQGSGNVAVSVGDPASGYPAGTEDIVVLGSKGELVASLASTRATLDGVYPELSDQVGPPTLVPFGLDRAGTPALAWLTQHGTWYPSIVGQWSPRADVPVSPLLYNSGHLHHAVPADLDGDGLPELVAVGLNNPLGYQGVLVLLRPSREWRRNQEHSYSPDLTSRWAPAELARQFPLIAYTPFGQTPLDAEIRKVDGEAITLASDTGEVRFDLAGNPLSSPLAGHGSERRMRFWVDLGHACLALESGEDGAASMRTVELAYADVLSEAPMRLAAELMLARALARGGRHEEAVTLLLAATRRSPQDADLWLRLGEQLAIAGHPAEAVEALDRMGRLDGRGRGPGDPATAKAFVGAWTGESAWLQQAKARWAPHDADRANATFTRSLDALWAFCRGTWDDPSFSAIGEGTSSAPWTRVLVPWAEMETSGDPGAAATTAERLASDPELRDLADLLRARSLTRSGDARRALDLASEALASLQRRGRTSVEAHVWTALAHRAVADAAAATDDRIAVERHSREAARIAPACWFGRRR